MGAGGGKVSKNTEIYTPLLNNFQCLIQIEEIDSWCLYLRDLYFKRVEINSSYKKNQNL